MRSEIKTVGEICYTNNESADIGKSNNEVDLFLRKMRMNYSDVKGRGESGVGSEESEVGRGSSRVDGVGLIRRFLYQ